LSDGVPEISDLNALVSIHDTVLMLAAVHYVMVAAVDTGENIGWRWRQAKAGH